MNKLSNQLAQMLEVANTAYDDTGMLSLPTLEETYKGRTGDSLGAFVVIEIAEVTEGMWNDEVAWGEAQRAIQSATDQLQAVADALGKHLAKFTKPIPQGNDGD